MTTIPQVAEAMQTVLTSKADRAALQTGFVQRPTRTKLTGSLFVQSLVLGWLANPEATLEQLTEIAARQEVDITPQALDQRFTPAGAACLRQVLADTLTEVVSGTPVALPILQRFTAMVVQDGTTIALPDSLAEVWQGCGGSETGSAAALKCGLQLDLLHGRLCQLDLVDGRHPDAALPLQHASLPAGSLRAADLGFFDQQVFAELDAAEVYWLSRTRSQLTLSTGDGQVWSLLDFVQTQLAAGGEATVGLGRMRVPARLLVTRVPQEVADQRRRRLRKEARERGRMVSATVLALADWTILITNAPAELLSAAEALVVARVRWQIELIFKLWKSQGKLDESRSSKPWRILCEVYAKLIALIIQHWLLVVSCWQYPDRSLVKASQTVRSHAAELASTLHALAQLERVIGSIQRCLRRRARINPRSTNPNTYQLLLALTIDD